MAILGNLTTLWDVSGEKVTINTTGAGSQSYTFPGSSLQAIGTIITTLETSFGLGFTMGYLTAETPVFTVTLGDIEWLEIDPNTSLNPVLARLLGFSIEQDPAAVKIFDVGGDVYSLYWGAFRIPETNTITDPPLSGGFTGGDPELFKDQRAFREEVSDNGYYATPYRIRRGFKYKYKLHKDRQSDYDLFLKFNNNYTIRFTTTAWGPAANINFNIKAGSSSEMTRLWEGFDVYEAALHLLKENQLSEI